MVSNSQITDFFIHFTDYTKEKMYPQWFAGNCLTMITQKAVTTLAQNNHEESIILRCY